MFEWLKGFQPLKKRNVMTFHKTHQALGQHSRLQPQGLQEKRPNVPRPNTKNNFSKNCRLLTKSPEKHNTMLSLCNYYIYYIGWDGTLGRFPSNLTAARLTAVPRNAPALTDKKLLKNDSL